jgi:hypothetical protein
MTNGNRKIFISCGQYAEPEKELGLAIERLVRDLGGFEPYLAQNQSTLDSLTQTIFRAIDECTGFIGVMHHRGEVSTPDGKTTRGSIWIEQEIAIAAFLRQLLGRDLKIRMYTQRGIALEGIRKYLQTNPTEFESNEEVLADLRLNLRDWAGQIAGGHRHGLDLEIQHKRTSPTGDYRLQVMLKNEGTSVASDYTVTVEFPLVFRPHTSHALYVGTKGTKALYRRTPDPSGGFKLVYPGEPIEVVGFDYYAPTNSLGIDLSEKVTAQLILKDELIQTQEKALAELL